MVAARGGWKNRKTATQKSAATKKSAATRARVAAPRARDAAPRARGAAPRAREAAPSARAAPRARVAPGARLTRLEQAEYSLLRKKVISRKRRNISGSSDAQVLEEIDAALTPLDRLKKARLLVGTERRRALWDHDFQPSKGHQIHDQISLETLRVLVVRKVLHLGNPAYQRTISLYAAARRKGVEGDVPLPRLYQVFTEGKLAYFDLEYMGTDALVAKVHRTEFRELRNRAIAELKRLLDVVPKSVTKQFKNWCITQRRTDAMRRAYLIDLGNVCIRGAPAQRESS